MSSYVNSDGNLVAEYNLLWIYGLQEGREVRVFCEDSDLNVYLYPIDQYVEKGEEFVFVVPSSGSTMELYVHNVPNEVIIEYVEEAPEPEVIDMYSMPSIVPAAVSSELDDGGEERIHIAPYVEPPAVVPPVETGELCINFAEGLQVLESELIGLGFDVNGQTITATWGGDRKFYLDLNGDPIIYAYGDYVNDEGVEVELTDGARTVIVTTKLAGYLYSDAGGIIYDLGDFSWFEGDSFDLEWYIEGGGRGTWVRDGTMFFPTAWNFPPNEFVFGKFIADDEEYCAVFDRWEG